MPSRAASIPPLPSAPPRAYVARGADVTRERLLQATHELLFETGGAEPSVSQICARAGVQAGMVSYCFGGKAKLLEALLQRAVEQVESELAQLAASDLPPTEQLRVHITTMIRRFRDVPYVSQLGERLSGPDGARSAPMSAMFAGPMIAYYRDLLADGARRGELREVDPTFFFFTTVGMCEYLFAARSHLTNAGEPLDDALVERFTDHTIERVLSSIAPIPGGRP